MRAQSVFRLFLRGGAIGIASAVSPMFFSGLLDVSQAGWLACFSAVRRASVAGGAHARLGAPSPYFDGPGAAKMGRMCAFSKACMANAGREPILESAPCAKSS